MLKRNTPSNMNPTHYMTNGGHVVSIAEQFDSFMNILGVGMNNNIGPYFLMLCKTEQGEAYEIIIGMRLLVLLPLTSVSYDNTSCFAQIFD